MPFSVRKCLAAAAMCALLTAPSVLAAGDPPTEKGTPHLRRTPLQEDPLSRIDYLENEVMANIMAIDNLEQELGLGNYSSDYGPLRSVNEKVDTKKVTLKIFGCYKL